MKSRTPEPKGPFSRQMSIEELLALPDRKIVITASPEECVALAQANDLIAIGRLEATFKVSAGAQDLHLGGQVSARVTQECVVTLEPFEADVVETIDIRFAPITPERSAKLPQKARGLAGEEPKGRRKKDSAKQIAAKESWSKQDWNKTDWSQQTKAAPKPADSIKISMDSDPPEPVEDGHIDLGAVAAEFLALGLDPYPRKPGIAFSGDGLVAEQDEAPEEKPDNPFAALARLKLDTPDKTD